MEKVGTGFILNQALRIASRTGDPLAVGDFLDRNGLSGYSGLFRLHALRCGSRDLAVAGDFRRQVAGICGWRRDEAAVLPPGETQSLVLALTPQPRSRISEFIRVDGWRGLDSLRAFCEENEENKDRE